MHGDGMGRSGVLVGRGGDHRGSVGEARGSETGVGTTGRADEADHRVSVGAGKVSG